MAATGYNGEVWRIALAVPGSEPYDYLPPAVASARFQPGVRVRVPLGGAQRVGVVVERCQGSGLPLDRLKRVGATLDDRPVLPPDLWRSLLWAASYYLHPLGEVLEAALPQALRRGEPLEAVPARIWTLTPAGRALGEGERARRPRQAALLAALEQADVEDAEAARLVGGRAGLRALEARGWIGAQATEPASGGEPRWEAAPVLTEEQQATVQTVTADMTHYGLYLLDGVTGSGKTEVYLNLAQAALAAGRQVLVLAPEIGLVPQLVQRFAVRFGAPVAVLHSAQAEGARLAAWRAAATGAARIVIGARSALFAPLPALGLIVVDEEHDTAYKQQEGFRYHGRDLAIYRGREAGVPVVLGSATPALETLALVEQGRCRRLRLSQRAGSAQAPEVSVVDLRAQPLTAGLSHAARLRLKAQVETGGQVLLFINRRGFATRVHCPACGEVESCPRCDTPLVAHRQEARLRCHHCGHERPWPQRCAHCGGPEPKLLGRGTERIEQMVRTWLPEAGVLRVDRDTTRRRGAMARHLEEAHSGRARILVGTQMLAKGHDLPELGLAVLVNADQGLYGVDFRAPERMVQLIVQAAGRAGRAGRPGEVLLQTWNPDHPLLQCLLRGGYAAAAQMLLAERRAQGWPPYASLALLSASAHDSGRAQALLEQARGMEWPAGVEVLGPAPAVLPRRAGRWRWQLLLRARERRPLHVALRQALPLLRQSPAAKRVRWQVDVDPQQFE
jgi:primosomal protein N' (replication factor Y)